VAITYDAIGDPLNDGAWNYTWTSGRQLSQMSKDGMSVLFKYDHNGLRSQKSVTENGTTTTTDYIYHGKLLAAMTRGSDVLRFEYDAQSRPTVVMFNGIRYVYLHNIQSDIVGIMDASGNLVVEYRYDAWGKPLSTTGSMTSTLGMVNPLRYRGYVYDEETELYYCRERFYHAGLCRFVNDDQLVGKIGEIYSHNCYEYCQNNCVALADPLGRASVVIIYDGRPNTTGNDVGGFVTQAAYYETMFELAGFHVEKYDYTDMSPLENGFIGVWNQLEGDIDILIIIGHGTPGTMDAAGTRLTRTKENVKCYSYDWLKNITVNECIYLYTCNGASPSPQTGISAAEELSKKAGGVGVYALYYAKTYWIFNRWLVPRRDYARRKENGISIVVPSAKWSWNKE